MEEMLLKIQVFSVFGCNLAYEDAKTLNAGKV
jgi:hypothetical protein